MDSYYRLKFWFLLNYEHLGFDLSPFYQDEDNLKFYFGILYNNNKTGMCRISLENVLDFTTHDLELRKLIFDTLLTTYGYRVDGDFTPIKKVKQFEL